MKREAKLLLEKACDALVLSIELFTRPHDRGRVSGTLIQLDTTADFQGAAADVALEPGFPRIGLIHGRQLVDLLIEHWGDIPPEFRERLGLKPGLVRT